MGGIVMMHNGIEVAHGACTPRKTEKATPAIPVNMVNPYTTMSVRFAIPANVCSLRFFITRVFEFSLLVTKRFIRILGLLR